MMVLRCLSMLEEWSATSCCLNELGQEILVLKVIVPQWWWRGWVSPCPWDTAFPSSTCPCCYRGIRMESIHRGSREMCWLLAETAAAQRAVWEEQSCAFKWGVFKQSFQLVHPAQEEISVCTWYFTLKCLVKYCRLFSSFVMCLMIPRSPFWPKLLFDVFSSL